MTADVEAMQDKASNACCAALTMKHSKLLEKYSKLEELKNKFRNCTALVQEKYDVVEKENGVLKKALEELKVQANIWKDEKEKECGRCVDLEDEVSALKEEVQLLKQNHKSASQDAEKEIQERLNAAEKEIKHLKDLLDKERERAALEKKNAELERKKAGEALKKVGAGIKKVSEAQKTANVEKKKAEENRLLWEKLKTETDAVKSMLVSERSKAEAADKKVEAEKQKTLRERKRADLAEAKSEEQRELAETNLKKAKLEKDRADDLNRKLEEVRIRAEKLEESHKLLCSEKIVEAQADKSRSGKSAELSSDACVGMLKNDAQLSKWMEKILSEKELNTIREKKRAESEKKKAKKQKKVAEAHKKLAMEQKHRADQLSNELESYKLRLKELQKELQEFASRRINADNAPLRNNEVISETDTVKLLKKRLKLEKMLVKHANETAKVEALRTNMLHRELFHLKQECLWFQQRLDLLDKSFLHGLEGTHHLEKLLDLDDAADESSYRRAIAMPLSPMLSEVEIHGDEKLVDNPEMLAHKSFPEGSSNLQPMDDSVDFLKSVGSVSASDTLFNEIHVTGGKLEMSDLAGSRNKETNILCERGIASNNGWLLRYFVVSSDHKDNSSILRILHTMGSCMPRCSFLQSTEIFLRSILHALSKAEDLSMKEKVCVFFSLVLHVISEVGINSLTGFLNDKLVQSFDSVTKHIHSALSDPVLRRIFMESCDLFELFAVIENFILQRKVFACGELSGESESTHSFKANLVLNGNAIMVSEVVASSQLLIAGGSMLASLCTAVDHIGLVCEMSCNIITMQNFDRPVMLAILHAFAYLCGSKYFTLERYSIAMTVVKSLVMFLEKQTLQTNSTSFCPSMVGNQSNCWLCSTNCLFSEGPLSMEDVALLLLENLQKHGQSKCWPQDLIVPRVWSHEGRSEEVSGSREAVVLSSTSDENLCDVIDILSLVEILASFMSWDWTFDHIIGQICEYLESHLMEGFSAAIIVLIGQLGRLGVGACGYEDARVKKLRGRLSAFVCETTFRKLNISVQFAVITSLFGLISIKFEEIVEGKVGNPAATSRAIPVSFIREWFFRLSYEQQSLFRLHQAENEQS